MTQRARRILSVRGCCRAGIFAGGVLELHAPSPKQVVHLTKTQKRADRAPRSAWAAATIPIAAVPPAQPRKRTSTLD